MDSVVLCSPSSDDRFWDGLRTRVDTILEDRRLVSSSSAAAAATCGAASERPKRLREDSLMLVRGLDSVAASLAQLSDTLTAAQKGVNALATCPSQARECERDEEEEEPHAKRQCGASTEFAALHAGKEGPAADDAQPRDEATDANVLASAEVAQSTNLKRARSLAVSMAGRAANLARELKNIKSELHFMQERCGMLEEENRRLRDGYQNGGAAPEEDDLVRLQLEALLAEKSRLAQENANLARENQSLIQLVEYHQITSQEDLGASYDDVMEGMRLDFDGEVEGEFDNDDGVPVTPGNKLAVLGSPE
uniref:Uncharacterized protein n=1 Tax=Avena sativa TaxID=4498 RepID=A0ACD5WNE9_AVESA